MVEKVVEDPFLLVFLRSGDEGLCALHSVSRSADTELEFTFYAGQCSPVLPLFPGLISPEGLAIDHFRRTMYWTDSGLDKIERAGLDGSERKVLFHTDLVNPRAITVDPIRG